MREIRHFFFNGNKSKITNYKYQMVRQAVRQAHGPEQSRGTHHLTTLSQVEGQLTMT